MSALPPRLDPINADYLIIGYVNASHHQYANKSIRLQCYRPGYTAKYGRGELSLQGLDSHHWVHQEVDFERDVSWCAGCHLPSPNVTKRMLPAGTILAARQRRAQKMRAARIWSRLTKKENHVELPNSPHTFEEEQKWEQEQRTDPEANRFAPGPVKKAEGGDVDDSTHSVMSNNDDHPKKTGSVRKRKNSNASSASIKKARAPSTHRSIYDLAAGERQDPGDLRRSLAVSPVTVESAPTKVVAYRLPPSLLQQFDHTSGAHNHPIQRASDGREILPYDRFDIELRYPKGTSPGSQLGGIDPSRWFAEFN
ncbi:hypothetical protein BT63DRAFT_456729 [Microthyrium microscopicum]|uniref:Uncharacterized protein n=1 Tax=Microthyrium microscopicum TaxID=703497 RepID=A0A6A6U5K6_9PEZI|nr:hypothetical protein BT63DRAFT_456729 [Microthyrium microscopicum]